MLNAIPVSLVEHDPAWTGLAARHAAELSILGSNLVTVHHLGSTSIPGLLAKPIIDLLPVVADLAALDAAMPHIEALGYECHGEYGIPGRRFCALPGQNTRIVHLHFFEQGSEEILHNLAFREYVRAHPEIAADYAAEKRRARHLHVDNSHGYTTEKSAFVARTVLDALAWYSQSR